MTFADPSRQAAGVLESGPEPGNPSKTAVAVRPLVLLGGQLITGVAIGLIWLAWAPRTVSLVLPTSGNRMVLIPDESEAQMAGDGRLALLCAAAGLTFGLLAWFGMRNRGPLILGVVGMGSLVSSLVAIVVGSGLSAGADTGAPRAMINPPLALHATPILVIQTLVALIVYTALAGLSSDPHLGASDSTPADVPAIQSPPLPANLGAGPRVAGSGGASRVDPR